MIRLCQTLAAPPAGFSPSAQLKALRRLLVLAAAAALLGGLPLLSPRLPHLAAISAPPLPHSAAISAPAPNPPRDRQARRPKTMVATAVSAARAEPCS